MIPRFESRGRRNVLHWIETFAGASECLHSRMIATLTYTNPSVKKPGESSSLSSTISLLRNEKVSVLITPGVVVVNLVRWSAD